MALSNFDKKVLNDVIDSVINDIGSVVEFARIPEFKGMLKDKDATDFSLGIVIGEIHTAFLAGFKQRYHKEVTKDERDELFRMLGMRIGEIHEAIFKCG